MEGLTKDDEASVANMLASEGWKVMERLIDAFYEWGITSLRITDSEMNKILYTEKDLINKQLDFICLLKD